MVETQIPYYLDERVPTDDIATIIVEFNETDNKPVMVNEKTQINFAYVPITHLPVLLDSKYISFNNKTFHIIDKFLNNKSKELRYKFYIYEKKGD